MKEKLILKETATKCGFFFKKYYGYNQTLLVIFDGIDISITITPDDPVFGVYISFCKNIENEFILSINDFSICHTEKIIKNINDAKNFIKEFESRYNEIMSFEGR